METLKNKTSLFDKFYYADKWLQNVIVYAAMYVLWFCFFYFAVAQNNPPIYWKALLIGCAIISLITSFLFLFVIQTGRKSEEYHEALDVLESKAETVKSSEELLELRKEVVNLYNTKSTGGATATRRVIQLIDNRLKYEFKL